MLLVIINHFFIIVSMLRDNMFDIRQIMGIHTDVYELQNQNDNNENDGAINTNDMI